MIQSELSINTGANKEQRVVPSVGAVHVELQRVYVSRTHRTLLLLSTPISAVPAFRRQRQPPTSQAAVTFLAQGGNSWSPPSCLVDPLYRKAGGPTFPTAAAAATPSRYGSETNYTGSYCCQD